MNFCMCQYVCFQHLPAFLRGCPGCPSTCAGHSRHHQLQFRHQWPLESSVSVGRDGRSTAEIEAFHDRHDAIDAINIIMPVMWDGHGLVLGSGLRMADAISHNSAMGACKSWAMACEVHRSMQRSISSDIFSSWARRKFQNPMENPMASENPDPN